MQVVARFGTGNFLVDKIYHVHGLTAQATRVSSYVPLRKKRISFWMIDFFKIFGHGCESKDRKRPQEGQTPERRAWREGTKSH